MALPPQSARSSLPLTTPAVNERHPAPPAQAADGGPRAPGNRYVTPTPHFPSGEGLLPRTSLCYAALQHALRLGPCPQAELLGDGTASCLLASLVQIFMLFLVPSLHSTPV